MRAGSMNDRIALLEPVRPARRGAGAQKEEWREHAPRWAEYRAGNSGSVISDAEIFGTQTATFYLRDFDRPHAGWRLRHIGGGLYRIIAEPVVSRTKGMLTLSCELVNQ